jgi:hypothetical protein
VTVPSDAERLAALEEWRKHVEASLVRIEDKQDQILAAANMGKGAYWAVVKLGGLCLLVLGAGAWVVEIFLKIIGKH